MEKAVTKTNIIDFIELSIEDWWGGGGGGGGSYKYNQAPVVLTRAVITA